MPDPQKQKINVQLDSMNSGSTVRRLHLDEWRQYEDALNAGASAPGTTVERMACEITRIELMEKNLKRMKCELEGYMCEDAT